MSNDRSGQRDERTVAVENASYKWVSIFVTYALLIDVVYRGVVRNEAAWDLIALVIVSGAIAASYQVRQKTLGQGWVRKVILIALVAGLLAFGIVSVLSITKIM